MSITTTGPGNPRINSIEPYPQTFQYIRPPQWVDLPDVTPADQKFVGLYAVFPAGSNFIAFTIAGAYTVDWGDGSATENFNSGATAQHEYAYGDLSSSTEFRGYRQAVVTITMQSGQNLTSVNLTVRHSGASAVVYNTGWLDIKFGSANLTTITALGVQTPTTNVQHNNIESIEVVRSNMSSFSVLFRYIYNLRRLIVNSDATVTNISGIATADPWLTDIYFGFTCANVNCDGAFASCTTLKFGPEIRGTLGNCQGMFNVCSTLLQIPFYDTTNVANFSQFLRQCPALTSLPLLNTSNATTFNAAFGCGSLTEFPLLDTSKVGDFQSAFSGLGVTDMPLLNTSNVTQWTTAFQSCQNLQTIPSFDVSKATNFNATFNGCRSLLSIPDLDAPNVADMRNMVQNCTSLKSIGNIQVGQVNTAGYLAFTGANACPSLAHIGIVGADISFNVVNCNLSATALNNLYSNLANVASATINVTGNYGAGSDDPTIAQNKGWTVTG